VQNRGGKAVVILPTDVAAQKPVFPMPGWTQRR
jgi:branched-chain amino acid transport system substrate-binding protein